MQCGLRQVGRKNLLLSLDDVFMRDRVVSESDPSPKKSLPQAAPVPVFNCVIHVAPDPAGGVRARCAVLEDFELTGSDERDALSKMARKFKDHVGALHADGQAIPLIDPPLPATDNEQTRWLPVHL